MAESSGGWVKDPGTGKWVKKGKHEDAASLSQKYLDSFTKAVDLTPPGVAKGTTLKVKADIAGDSATGYKYIVQGTKSLSKYPEWVAPNVLVLVMSVQDDYWVRCHKEGHPKLSWYFPSIDLLASDGKVSPPSGSNTVFSYPSYQSNTSKFKPKPVPTPFVSKLPEAEKLVEEMLELAGLCAMDLHQTANLKDPYKEQKCAMAWNEQVNTLQAQLVGWSIDLQEKLEDAELAIEKEEAEEIRKNATLDFFAGDADY